MAPEVQAPVTLEEFWHLSHRLQKAELVAGQVIELVPPGVAHGVLAGLLYQRLSDYLTRTQVGLAMVEVGFVLSTQPPTVRAPDVAVVLRPRMPEPIPQGFFPGPPDLAVEVLSSDDRPAEIAAKVADYLRAGTGVVWVVDPAAHIVTVHTSRGATRYAHGETLHDIDPLSGFVLPLRELFDLLG